MRMRMEHLGAPPLEYNSAYFANFIRALEAAMRRGELAPATPTITPGEEVFYLYSDGRVKISASFVPSDTLDIIPKGYVDSADQSLLTLISTNVADIASNLAKINTNIADIATNASDIATNAGDIAANTAAIVVNAGDIATNAGDIATNVTAIADLEARVTALENP